MMTTMMMLWQRKGDTWWQHMANRPSAIFIPARTVCWGTKICRSCSQKCQRSFYNPEKVNLFACSVASIKFYRNVWGILGFKFNKVAHYMLYQNCTGELFNCVRTKLYSVNIGFILSRLNQRTGKTRTILWFHVLPPKHLSWISSCGCRGTTRPDPSPPKMAKLAKLGHFSPETPLKCP